MADNEQEERERLRYLQLKAKAAAADSEPVPEDEQKESPSPEKKPSIPESLFPRTTETMKDVKAGEGSFLGNVGKVTRDLTLDELSMAGRALASLPTLAPGGESFSQAMTRKEAPESAGAVRTFTEDVARDPALIPGIAATGGATSLLKAPAKPAIRMGVKEIGKRAGVTAGRGALESIPSAAVHQTEGQAETGEFDALAGVGEIAAGAGFGLGTKLTKGVLSKALNGPKDAAAKIMAGYLKAPLKIYDDGYDPKNIGKHGLFGTTGEIVALSNVKLKSASGEMDRLLKDASKEGATVDAAKAVFDALRDIEANKLDTKAGQLFMKTGDKRNVEAAAQKVAELFEYLTDGNDQVDLEVAQRLKQTIGNLGDWSHGRNDAELDAVEAIANRVYMNLKRDIEAQLPDKAKALNKAMSEIIPIKRAAIRRLPIDQRNDAIGLADVTAFTNAFSSSSVEGGALGVGLGILRKITKSPLAAEALNMAGTPGKAAAPIVVGAGQLVAPEIRQGMRTAGFRVTNPEEEEKERQAQERMAKALSGNWR